MPRIEGVPEGANLFVRAVNATTRRKIGRMVQPVAIAAHHPRLLVGMGAFEEALARSRRVETRLKSLAELQAAANVGCPF
jgi:hypothetical protein